MPLKPPFPPFVRSAAARAGSGLQRSASTSTLSASRSRRRNAGERRTIYACLTVLPQLCECWRRARISNFARRFAPMSPSNAPMCRAWTQMFDVKSAGIFLATSPRQSMSFANASSPWPMHQKHHLRLAISRAAWPYARALATNLSACACESK